jgi:hypothetical protein
MSWQAIEWALKQRTGYVRRKALLLALASYADPVGVCWPSQERLARDTEQSVDSIQRHSRVLEEINLIRREKLPKRRGHYGSYCYFLAMETDSASARDEKKRAINLRLGQAANGCKATPQNLRHKPSIKPSYKPSGVADGFRAVDNRLYAFQEKQEPLEAVQNRLAQKIGPDGWLVLGAMKHSELDRLSRLERQGKLNDDTLRNAVCQVSLLLATGGGSNL